MKYSNKTPNKEQDQKGNKTTDKTTDKKDTTRCLACWFLDCQCAKGLKEKDGVKNDEV